MIQSLKRLVNHTALYGISDVLGRSIAFIMVPIYTNVLTPEQMGNFVLIYAFIGLMIPVFAYGMESAFLRYYLLDTSKKQQVLSTGYLTMIGTTIGFTGIVYLNAPLLTPIIFTSDTLDLYVQLAALVLGLDALNVIPFARLRGEEHAGLFAGLKLFKVLLEFSGNIWLVVINGMGPEGVLISNIIGSGTVCMILTVMTLRHLTRDWSYQRLLGLLKFALPYIPAAACIIVIEMIDRFMIKYFEGPDVVAIYSATRRLGVGMLLFVNVFRLAWQPFFLEASKQDNAKPLFARVLTYFLLITGGIFLGISILVDDLVRLPIGDYTFFDQAYWNATYLVPLFLLAYMLYGLYVNLMVGIYLEKKTTYLPIITGTAAGICIAANFILIPRFGMQGAAIAAILAYAIMVTGLYIVAQRHYPIEYEGLRLLKVVIAGGIVYFVGQTMVESVIYELGILLCYPVLLISMRFFNVEEIDYLKKRLGFGVKNSGA